MKPIGPNDVADEKVRTFPPEVWEVFNTLIAASSVRGVAKVSQKRVTEALVAKGYTWPQISAGGWLNVEDVYTKLGWIVKYDKPGWDESYDPTYSFENKRNTDE